MLWCLLWRYLLQQPQPRQCHHSPVLERVAPRGAAAAERIDFRQHQPTPSPPCRTLLSATVGGWGGGCGGLVSP